VTLVAGVAGLDEGIARRMARKAGQSLEGRGLAVNAREESWEGGPGCALALHLETTPVPVTVCVAGERGKPAEKVASEAVAELAAYIGAASGAVDSHSGDQILLPLALAEGASEYTVAELTRHLTTNAAVIRRFIEREIVIEGDEGGPGTVKVLAGGHV
jgi:RNA 3'-terminal phosphate cyclase (ATP)